MATRGDIKGAFYNELVNAVATTHTIDYGDGSTDTVTLTTEDIRLTNPNEPESLPKVIFTDTYTPFEHNGVGTAPDKIVRNQDGSVDKEVWKEYETGEYTVYVEAEDELVKEPIYEAIRRQFGQYNTPLKADSELHTDCSDVRVGTTLRRDFTEVEQVIRNDSVEVFIDFNRNYERSEENIEQVNHDIDNNTYTTTTSV